MFSEMKMIPRRRARAHTAANDEKFRRNGEEGEEEEQDRHVPGGFGTSAPCIPAAVRISIAPVVSLVTEQSRTERRARRPEYKRETRRMERKRFCCKIASRDRGADETG